MANTLAILSLIAALISILWLFPVPSILAVLLGIYSIKSELREQSVVLGTRDRKRYQKPKFEFNKGSSIARAGVIIGGITLILSLVFVTAFDTCRAGGENAMGDLIVEGDKVLIYKFAFGSSGPQENDLVAFRFPLNPSKTFIQRCVANGGDVVRLINKQLLVNNHPYRESSMIFRSQAEVLPAVISNRDNFGPYVVPGNSFFLLGDDRDNSFKDGRNSGAVHKEYLIGKPVFILYSFRPSAKFRLSTIFERLNLKRIGPIRDF
ncbi:signal peptidase I [bacterium]|nr:signal peptidase I [bacterium]